MSPHISNVDLKAYFAKSMSPEALIVFDEHLSDCKECKERFITAGKQDLDSIDNPMIRRALNRESASPEEGLFSRAHLSFEEIEACVKKNTSPEQQARIAAHLKSCSMCAGEFRDLESFALQITNPTPTERLTSKLSAFLSSLSYLVHKRWAVASVLAVCGSVAVFVYMQKRGTKETITVEDHWEPAVVPIPSGESHEIENLPIRPTEVSAEDIAALDAARVSKSISTPAILKNLTGTTEALLGTSVAEQTSSLIEPVGEVAPESMPLFKWTPIEGAKSYSVDIFGESFELIQESGAISETKWKAKHPLKPGITYVWQVTAQMADGRTEVAPKPPAPEAKFMVMDPREAKRLAKIAAHDGDDHLLLAVLYGRAGAVQSSERELRRIPRDDPDYALAQDLLASLGKQHP